MVKGFLRGLALVGILIGAPAAARDNHALLVGAGVYPNLDESLWLTGPANDVDLVRGYLVANPVAPFKAQNITVLADGIEGAEAPTLAAIRAAMADLAGRVQPDDFVYLHFSGHGSQMPAADPDSELDGLDEIFLPSDVGPWDDTIGSVTNALVDDEIGAMIGRLRDRGATVWAVFDACHSGTVTRAAPTGDTVRLRRLDPAQLGVPDQGVQTRALPRPDQAPLDDVGTGGFVAFFAAQTNETTPERRLPRGKLDRRTQGVFTFTLFETLAAHPGLTYRQLGQEIMRRYGVDNLARATPLFEGDLDGPVFATGGGARVAQWPLGFGDDGPAVPAGTLHGLAPGDRLAVMRSPADATDAAMGYLIVRNADVLNARLGPDDAGTLAAIDIPEGAYVRRLDQRVSFAMDVARPETGTAPAAAFDAALDALQASLSDTRIRIVPAGAPADLRLAVLLGSPRPDALWVLPDNGLVDDAALEATPSVETAGHAPEDLGVVLGDTLTRMARVRNLMALAGAGGDLDVQVALRTRSPANRVLNDLQTLPIPRLIPDDEVHILARNDEDVPLDLNVLYIGRDHSIQHMYKGRLHPGDSLKKGLLRITDTSFGRDRLILVFTPAGPQTAVEDLSFLEQDEMPILRDGGSGFRRLLMEAGFGTATRAAIALEDDSAGPAPAILHYAIDTVPARP